MFSFGGRDSISTGGGVSKSFGFFALWALGRVRTRGGEKPAVCARRPAVYVSKVDFKRELYDGEHAAIVDAVLFDRVLRALESKTCGRGRPLRHRAERGRRRGGPSGRPCRA